MTYQNAIDAFERSESGTDSFKNLYRSLLQLMKADPADAAAYYILATAAHNYVLRYEDQALEAETADGAKASLLDLCKRFAKASKGSAEDKLSALSSIASDYEWRVVSF